MNYLLVFRIRQLKSATALLLALTLVLVAGCSKSNSGNNLQAILVPTTVDELIDSPRFILEHTTESGIKCYTRILSKDEYFSIPDGSSDQKYLVGSEKFAFLAVPVKDGQFAVLSTREKEEFSEFTMKKLFAEDPAMQQVIEKAQDAANPPRR